MATYTIASGADRGFNIKVVGDDGTRQTLLGFETQAAAEAWIVEDRKRSNQKIEGSPRTEWEF